MSELEQLKARIAALESEELTVELERESIEPKAGKSMFDPDFGKNQPPLPPRYVKPEDCEDRSIGFRIGQWFVDGERRYREAIPRPTYRDAGGRPGDLVTNDLLQEYFCLNTQAFHAAMDLESCIRYTRQKLACYGELDECPWLNRHIERWEDSDEKRRLAEKWNFLQGLWIGRGMTPISEQLLERWAREGWRPE